MKQIIRLSIAILLLFFASVGVAKEVKFYNPSFDCSKVKKGSIEYKICTNKKLSDLDQEVGDVYQFLLKKISNKKAFKADQITWLKKVRNFCIDFKCLNKVYNHRIIYLDSVLRSNINNNYKKGFVFPNHLWFYDTAYLQQDSNKHIKKFNNPFIDSFLEKHHPDSANFLKRFLNKENEVLYCDTLINLYWKQKVVSGGICYIKYNQKIQLNMICDDNMVGHHAIANDKKSNFTLHQLYRFATTACGGG